MMKRFNNNITLYCMSAFLLFPSAGSSEELTSHVLDQGISVDGNSLDWQGKLTYLEDKELSVGVMNDETDLYLCLISKDQPLIAQVLRLGLTVWFDPEGGKKKTFGIRYPAVATESATSEKEMGSPPAWPMPEPVDLENNIAKLRESRPEIAILGPEEKEIARIPFMNNESIAVDIGSSSYGQFIFELQVPLKNSPSTPYTVQTSPGEMIGLGFETSQIDLQQLRREMLDNGVKSGDRSGRWGDPPGGMRGGGRSGMEGDRVPRMGEPLRLWTIATLAVPEEEWQTFEVLEESGTGSN